MAAPLPSTPVMAATSSAGALTSKPTQSLCASTRAKARGLMPALCRPTRKPSSRTVRMASPRAACRVASPPLKTTACNRPWRRRRKSSRRGQGISSAPRGAISSGLWQ
ncbi:Uncharacterised protein [Acinetobacter baumannii]|nr:Uncharacterised protein [Acinetobacter baumannii]